MTKISNVFGSLEREIRLTCNASPSSFVSVALIHHPVYDKHREVVATAVTNFDLHDIARAAKTFGLNRYYVVTPVPDQQVLAGRIAGHWQTGWGAGYNPKRKAALDLLRIVGTLDDAVADIAREQGQSPETILTGARKHPRSISFGSCRELIQRCERPYLLVLGTGWGLTDELFEAAGHVLDPTYGVGEYNHLSVRSAAAIIFDRLFGQR